MIIDVGDQQIEHQSPPKLLRVFGRSCALRADDIGNLGVRHFEAVGAGQPQVVVCERRVLPRAILDVRAFSYWPFGLAEAYTPTWRLRI
jgi:hypothetical protein